MHVHDAPEKTRVLVMFLHKWKEIFHCVITGKKNKIIVMWRKFSFVNFHSRRFMMSLCVRKIFILSWWVRWERLRIFYLKIVLRRKWDSLRSDLKFFMNILKFLNKFVKNFKSLTFTFSTNITRTKTFVA
jgi:hypothetical protein